jgi:hypothetical protein
MHAELERSRCWLTILKTNLRKLVGFVNPFQIKIRFSADEAGEIFCAVDWKETAKNWHFFKTPGKKAVYEVKQVGQVSGRHHLQRLYPIFQSVKKNVGVHANHDFCGLEVLFGRVEKNKMLTSILRHLLSGYIGIGLWDCAVQENSLALANLKKIKSTMN